MTPAMLEVIHLRAGYGNHRVLHDISLSLAARQVVALIGPNGSGKSTLIRAVSGAIPMQGGSVRIQGKDLAALDFRGRARCMAVVPQARNLPEAFTAWETVLLGRTPHLGWLGQLSPADEDRVRQAMQRTDTLGLASRRMGELSGGEQQRILLARALAQASPLLLLDEPTAHLDLQYQVSLLHQIQDLAHQDGYAALLAIHDLNLAARFADQVILLVQGEVHASGSPEEVLQAGRLSQAYRLPLLVLPAGPDGHLMVIPDLKKG